MSIDDQIKTILVQKFASKHVDATIKHLSESIKKYRETDWEGSILRIAKFIEAVIKMICVHCGQTLPSGRLFKAGLLASNLQTNKQLSSYSDTIRILIPKACVFIYDIANNRGARHDADEIDSNKMDASIALSTAKWILAELVRFSTSDSSSPDEAIDLVEILIEKQNPDLEEIDGRTYVNLKGLGCRETGLLILNATYPKRITREELKDLLKRHGYKDAPIAVAITRLKNLVDDKDGAWKLRGIGREEAEKIQVKAYKK